MADDPKPEGATPPENEPAPASATPPAEKPAAAEPKPAAAAPAAKPPAKPAAPKAPAVMETEPWSDELTEDLRAEFGDQITGFFSYVGQNFLTAVPDSVAAIVDYLKYGRGFDYLVDVTATDDPAKPERFELIYILYSFGRNERVRVKTRIAEGYQPATVTHVHLTANWLEREVFDMFGIEFAGHPDLKRILLPDEWQGHPLRKDYNILNMDQKWVQENLGIESGQ